MKHPRIYVFCLFFAGSFFSGLLTANEASANGFGELGAHLATDRTEDTSGAVSSERHFRFDLASGWQSSLSETQSVGYGVVFKTERGLQSGGEISGYGIGAFLAWYMGAFSIRADYLLLSELKSNNGVVETQFREGAGYVLEARWMHWLEPTDAGHRLALGPALAFTQMKYAKTRVGALPETGVSRSTESLTPGLRAIFVF